MGTIRLAGIVGESFTDGPGIRYTIFVQGCNHKCYKCQNPETWDFNGGTLCDIDKIVNQIKEDKILDGVTLSGGDPLYQADQILELAIKIKKETNLNIWLYTGFLFEDCIKDTKKLEILKNIDVIVDGMYKDDLRAIHLKFRGSSNQRIIDVKESLRLKKIITINTD